MVENTWDHIGTLYPSLYVYHKVQRTEDETKSRPSLEEMIHFDSRLDLSNELIGIWKTARKDNSEMELKLFSHMMKT